MPGVPPRSLPRRGSVSSSILRDTTLTIFRRSPPSAVDTTCDSRLPTPGSGRIIS
ncbi:hypothetical protein BV25DRAFT_1820913 [Artomyces pyxidatus]|uniref:Uncharacterized protein n=1 Tax=Artomyces pyxidatus TaxID=48021 RepID=A0ACB8TBX1_9AGAM|nr:hypothetical protein BV25DRAFT_1820913 [Artomyces pyxidatus]